MWQGDHKNGTNDEEEEDNEDDGDGHLWEGDHEDGTEESRGSEQQRNCWTQVLAASEQYCHDGDDVVRIVKNMMMIMLISEVLAVSEE